jgi:RNA polymerase sigma-70 factor (ECF subfamily)
MTTAPRSRDEFAEVAISYLNQLYGAARRLARGSADADDLVQETYHLAFEHYRELRSLAHCRAWLYRILHRQAVTRYRRRRSGPALVSIDCGGEDGADLQVAASFADEALEHLSLQEVRAAIAALPPDLRTTVTLCDVDGFRYSEIAEILDCPVGTVRSRLARARARLMGELRGHAAESGIHPGSA